MILKPAPINAKNFTGEKLEIKYGLPSAVNYCKSCVISNQRPNSAVEYKHTAKSKKTTINIDEHGKCYAYKMAERKNPEIDWEEFMGTLRRETQF
jgi:hypothetical protein